MKLLCESEGPGVSVTAKQYGVSEQSLYSWRKRFNGMGSEEVKRLQHRETEHARLKKWLVARDLTMEVMQEKEQQDCEKGLYKHRHLIENAFLKIKQWRGISARYTKKSKSFLAAIHLRCVVLWLKIS